MLRIFEHPPFHLGAEEDRGSISQARDKSAKNTVWTVEFVKGNDYIRLKSCFGTYLTASNEPFLPGVTGKKVIQTLPCQYDSPATEWQPLRDGMQVRLRSFWGNFLRPNGGLPPWRNSVTHDIPHRQKTRDKILWDVEVVETLPFHRKAQSDYLHNKLTILEILSLLFASQCSLAQKGESSQPYRHPYAHAASDDTAILPAWLNVRNDFPKLPSNNIVKR